MIYMIKTPVMREPDIYLLTHISKELIYYKYYTTQKLLEIPECVVNIDSFKARLIANKKHKEKYGKDKYKDLWDLITYPVLKRKSGKHRPIKTMYSFDVNAWPAST